MRRATWLLLLSAFFLSFVPLHVVPVGTCEQPGLSEVPAYVIGPGDELDISVLGYPELATKTIVLPDGCISFPFLTRVKAAGLTIDALALSLEKDLEPIIYTPQVMITVIQTRSKRYSVLGEVRKPGVFTLDDMNITVFEAIAKAEGFLPTSYKEQVNIMRPDSMGQQTSITVDMTGTTGGEISAFALRLRPGDIIYVPGPSDNRQVCVIGKVMMPGRYSVMPDMTVVDVLSAAGWVTKEGVSSSVMLIRREKNEYVYTRINAQSILTRSAVAEDIALKPGDIVYVPEQFVSKVSTFVNFFTTSVEPLAHTYLRVYDATNPASYVVER